nr:ephrin type-B receptor 1-like [Chlorocebus sabaeus]
MHTWCILVLQEELEQTHEGPFQGHNPVTGTKEPAHGALSSYWLSSWPAMEEMQACYFYCCLNNLIAQGRHSFSGCRAEFLAATLPLIITWSLCVLACPAGTFKASQEAEGCSHCPSNSRSPAEASPICTCRTGYYRADFDPPEVACTSVPSGPRNVISIVNETSIILEWHPPRETGGRDDVTYNIICKKCRADRRSCSRCDDNVEFVPRQLGLTECRVSISSLWAHTPYTFDIQAINGVSSKSPFPPQHVSVNITTNQAGKSRGFCAPVWMCGWLFVSRQGHSCRHTHPASVLSGPCPGVNVSGDGHL